jgi:predicted NBD/HSP70 family sugar kinase
MRRHNRARVLLEIQKGEACSRTQIAEVLGLSLMAVTRIVRELVAVGLVEEGEKSHSNSPGRRRTQLTLASGGGYVLGVSLNAYQPSVSLANIRGQVVCRRPLALDSLADSKRTVTACSDLGHELIKAAGIERERVLGLGAVIAGMVDHRRGVVLAAPFLGWGLTEIAGPLERGLRLPVVVENLDNALLLAEVRFGMAAGKSSVLFVRSAAGLGGSLYLDGQLIRGARFRAGQIGHLPLPGATRMCSCGQIGCLNTVCSGGAILAELGKATGPVLSPDGTRKNKLQLDRVLESAAAGDEPINKLLFQAGQRLGETVLRTVVVVDPEQILLAGPLGHSSSYQEGFKAGLAQRNSEVAGLVGISTMDDGQAAILLALSELVFSDRLVLRPGQAAARRQSRALKDHSLEQPIAKEGEKKIRQNPFTTEDTELHRGRTETKAMT